MMQGLVHDDPEEERPHQNTRRKKEIGREIGLSFEHLKTGENDREGGKRDGIEKRHRKARREVAEIADGTRGGLRQSGPRRLQSAPAHRDEEESGRDLETCLVIVEKPRDRLEPEDDTEGDDSVSEGHARPRKQPRPAIPHHVLPKAKKPDRTNRSGIENAKEHSLQNQHGGQGIQAVKESRLSGIGKRRICHATGSDGNFGKFRYSYEIPVAEFAGIPTLARAMARPVLRRELWQVPLLLRSPP
jgi:hypothetical protein